MPTRAGVPRWGRRVPARRGYLTADCLAPHGTYATYYTFELPERGYLRIAMSSSVVDATVRFRLGDSNFDGALSGSDDNSGQGSNALFCKFRGRGDFTLEATTSPSVTAGNRAPGGPFSLSIEAYFSSRIPESLRSFSGSELCHQLFTL